MLGCLALQNCQKLRKPKCSNSFHVCCHTSILFCIKRKYGFAGPTPSLVPVLAPPALGMETGQSAAAFQVINSVYSAYMSGRML